MPGVKKFLRRLSYREDKKSQQKSASTGHLAQKYQLQQSNVNYDESNLPYCLRQQQQRDYKGRELSKSHDHVNGKESKQTSLHIDDNYSNDQPPPLRGSHYNSLRSFRHHSVPQSQPPAVTYRPRHSTHFSTVACDKHRGSDNRESIVIRNPSASSSASLHNLKTNYTNVKSQFENNTDYNNLQNGHTLSSDDQTWFYQDVVLRKTIRGQGLGFTVAGGRDAPGGVHIDPQRSVFVQRIISGGIALADGRLRPRDIIMSVNEVEVQSSTHIHVVQLLKNSDMQVHLRVRRTPIMSGKLLEISLKKDSISRGLGFSIAGGVGTPELPDDDGIIISKIFNGGVAGMDGRLKVLDKILFVDDLDMIGRTHDEAVDILKSATIKKNTVTIQLLRKEDLENKQQQQQQQNTNNTSVESALYSKVMKKERDFIGQPSTNHEPGVHSPPGSSLYRPRRIIVKRGSPSRGLGINIIGGMGGRGLFVNYVLPDSPASEQTDLKRGDKLIRVNHVDLRGVSHGDAILALKNSGDHVVIIAQYKPEELEDFEKWLFVMDNPTKIVDDPTKSLLPSQDDVFLRSLFEYDPFLDVTFSPFDPAPIERLKVRFGDVFRISRKSLTDDWWQAVKVFSTEAKSSNNNNSHDVGYIPAKHNRAIQSQNLTSTNRKRNSTEFRTSKKRRSFIFSSKLKQAGKSGDKLGISSSPYEAVVLRQSLRVRPILILGPLKDRMNELLTSKYPHIFESCIPHTTRPMRPGEVSGREYVFVLTKQEMERQINRRSFVEVGVYKEHYYGVSYQAIKNISDQNKHCMLDVSMETLPRLHAADIFPIVIMIKATSNSLISSWLQTNDESRLKNLFEQTDLLFQHHKNVFSAVVEGGTEEDLFHGVMRAVENHGSMGYMWLPSDEKGY